MQSKKPQVSQTSTYKRSLSPWKVYRLDDHGKWHLVESYRSRTDAEEYAVILRRLYPQVKVVFE
ncbi:MULTISPECIES: hypothetical protein [Nostocales]|uniref:Uncharacterized protein n=1 Tax=Nostoc spongiaeforme FACHB-130 TaxID=1357510 RepID=A0ABR8FS71_9NOSO|nr:MULTISPECIES: hypothetical protein [Nostocales]MBD2489425.1 hypothetical protein [Aulosira sp. FACHB-615]MBD2592874.1 hypothetical protein [Nostoc spongiaeforme FACHB-130]